MLVIPQNDLKNPWNWSWFPKMKQRNSFRVKWWNWISLSPLSKEKLRRKPTRLHLCMQAYFRNRNKIKIYRSRSKSWANKLKLSNLSFKPLSFREKPSRRKLIRRGKKNWRRMTFSKEKSKKWSCRWRASLKATIRPIKASFNRWCKHMFLRRSSSRTRWVARTNFWQSKKHTMMK